MVFFNQQTSLHKDNSNRFKFFGFEPSPQLEESTKTLYKLIENHSPSDSKKQAVLIKNKSGFEARLKISSASSCSFEIVSKTKNDINSIDSLHKQFLNKILIWNQNKKPQDYKFEA